MKLSTENHRGMLTAKRKKKQTLSVIAPLKTSSVSVVKHPRGSVRAVAASGSGDIRERSNSLWTATRMQDNQEASG